MAFTIFVIILWENIPTSHASFDLLFNKRIPFLPSVLGIILVLYAQICRLAFSYKRSRENIIIEQNKMSKNGSLFPCNTKVPLAWLPTYIYCRRKIKKDLHPDECMFPVLYKRVYTLAITKKNVFSCS